MDLNNFILFTILIFFSLFFYNYFLLILKKLNIKLLVDNEFKKPQAFHISPISTSGGICIFLSFLILCFYFFVSKQIIYYEYLSFCTLFFILGLSDDLKLNIKPKFRLIIMSFFLIILIIFNKFYISNSGIEFLDRFLQIDIFALFFVSLCFLFIINGSNLIDGFNGLLGIHAFIILINLFFINYLNNNTDLAFFIFFTALIILIFIKYNFPNASFFLGDGGSYFLGTFIAISVIKTSLANPTISPFFFCILLFYLFFEVFFSFIRKISVEKRTPLLPDNKHLHMLIYKNLLKKNKNKLKSNYQVSLILNSVYLILIIPAIFMMNNGMFCKYYSILFFVIYLFAYKKVSEKLGKFL